MKNPIEDKIEPIRTLCAKYRVRRLELFGSAASEDNFDPETSDLDFLVEFHPLKRGEYADTYFGLLEELNQLFGSQVDLVMVGAITNPYFKESINKNKVLLYAA